MDPHEAFMQRPVSEQGTGSESVGDELAARVGVPGGSFRVLRATDELRALLAPARRAGVTIGLVPTMGALHQGHLSLITRAREQCGLVVVSLFVNPTQFEDMVDLERYPRSERRDAELAKGAGADLLFAPTADEVFPSDFSTTVQVLGPSERLEGEVRGEAHFRAVATVVVKLLNISAPDVAYFGQKDAQQVAVIRRLVRDLNLPVRIEVCPTVREPDGVAMSSRNSRLSPQERARAVALRRALIAATTRAAAGERAPRALLEIARASMAEFALEPEYLELVDPETLEPVDLLERPALLVVAARLGGTRLLDNVILEPSQPAGSHPAPGKEALACSA
jgi:pantoate--beta-alanine ligase